MLVLLPALLAMLFVPYYVFVNEDRDFYRPAHPLTCGHPSTGARIFRFAAFGDWGSGTAFQRMLAQRMADNYRQTLFPVVFLLGDNIYGDGDVRRLAKPYFEEPYTPLIRGGVRFWAALGNHDVRHGHMRDQMLYFKMPAAYYRVSYGPADFFILNTNDFAQNRKQQVWLAESLAKSRALWKIVLGHHPIYSSGRHGSSPDLRRVLEPLLIRYHADAYLAGHDHDYERFAPINGVRYIVSGGGGAFLTDFKEVQPNSRVRLRTHHFLLLEMAGQDIWLKSINRFGDVVDCDHWKKPPLLSEAV